MPKRNYHSLDTPKWYLGYSFMWSVTHLGRPHPPRFQPPYAPLQAIFALYPSNPTTHTPKSPPHPTETTGIGIPHPEAPMYYHPPISSSMIDDILNLLASVPFYYVWACTVLPPTITIANVLYIFYTNFPVSKK